MIGRNGVRRLVRLFVVLTMGVSVTVSPILGTEARADVAGSMDSYFSSMGVAANVTGPSAFQGQSAGYYSLGNVYTRFPQKTANLANIQLPGYRAGCGGIDIFAGSFSFISASELVAMLKAVANNAVGFAFKLAIDTLCPECGSTISELSQKVQQMNNSAMNSCQLAQGLVGSLWPKSDGADQEICEAIGTSKGIFSDAAASKHGCGSKGERESTLASGDNDDQYKDINTGVARNYTWYVLRKSPFFNPNGTLDRQLAEFAMTLVGTLIYQPSGAKTGGKYDLVAGNTTIAKALLEGTGGTDVKILDCGSDDDCLNPTTTSLTIDASKALRPRVKALIEGMVDAIGKDSAISDEQKQLLQIASLPLYKILAVQTAYSHGISTGDADTLAEVTAVDLMFDMIKQIMTEVDKTAAPFEGGDQDKLATWRGGIEAARQEVRNQQQSEQQRVQVVMQIVERTAFIESVLQSQMTPQMGASLDFARGISTGSAI